MWLGLKLITMSESKDRNYRMHVHLNFLHGECCMPNDFPGMVKMHRGHHPEGYDEDHILMRLPNQMKGVLHEPKKKFISQELT